MGPYMRPIPVGASSAMLFSLIVAFVVSPWAALRLLHHYADRREARARSGRLDHALLPPADESADSQARDEGWMFLGAVVVLLLAAVAFVPLKWVQVKMLPFDNKSEFQVDHRHARRNAARTDHPRGAGAGRLSGPAARGDQLPDLCGHFGPLQLQRPGAALLPAPPAESSRYSGQSASARRARKAQSHEIARRFRPELDKIAAPFGARIKVAEVPPGPPVLETLVAEVYGPDYKGQTALAAKIKKIFADDARRGGRRLVRGRSADQVRHEAWIWIKPRCRASPRPKSRARADRAGRGSAGLLHDPSSREDVPIEVRLSRPDRSSIEDSAEFEDSPAQYGGPGFAAGSDERAENYD